MDMKNKEDIYVLSCEGKTIFEGTHFECLYKLQRVQPFSSHYAFQWGGYKLTKKESNE